VVSKCYWFPDLGFGDDVSLQGVAILLLGDRPLLREGHILGSRQVRLNLVGLSPRELRQRLQKLIAGFGHLRSACNTSWLFQLTLELRYLGIGLIQRALKRTGTISNSN
jgi:hypothetical protein